MKHIIRFALFTTLGMGAGYLLGKMLKRGGEKIDPLWLLLLIPLVFAAVLLHEFGHAVGGWFVGFRLHLFAVGPLRIDREADGMRVRLNRDLTLWGGVAALAPEPEDLDGLRRRMATMVAGGPLMSLAGAILCGVAMLVVPAGAWRFALATLALLNAAICAATLIPSIAGGFFSDGARLKDLLGGSKAAERWCALMALSSLSIAQRPRRWPAALVEEVTALGGGGLDGAMAAWMRHLWHLDRQEFAEAGAWLETAVSNFDQLPASVRPLIAASGAYFEAAHGDLAAAERYAAQMSKSGFLRPEARLLADAALAIRAGCGSEAREKIRQARERARPLSADNREALAEYLDSLEARVRNDAVFAS